MSTVSGRVSVPSLPAGSVTAAVTVRVPSVSAAGLMFHVPPACTSARRLCASTVTRMTVSTAASLVPAIVGVVSFVVTDGPSSIVTTGRTVSIVSCWVALPVLPAPSTTEATTG